MKNKSFYFLIISTIVVFGFVFRLLPHEANFAPMGAIALFAVAFYQRKSLALIITGLAWFLSDLYLNNIVYPSSNGFTFFTTDQLFSILAIASIIGLGALLFKKINVATVLLGSVSASFIFFLVSNFGVWIQGYLYPMNFSGLISCYTMAIPFYKATFVSDLIFTGVFFSAMYALSNLVSFNKSATV